MIGRIYTLPPIWLEGRYWFEYAHLLSSPVFAGLGVPPGDGRPLVLIPGFMGGDESLAVMRSWLRRNGYRARRSTIGPNIDPSENLVGRLVARVLQEYRSTGRRVTLIGHSRGGVLALGVAQRHPELLDRVIAFGSPINDPLDIHPTTMAAVSAVRALHALQGEPATVDSRFDAELADPVTVPFTSIYSKTDGVVHWEACLRPDVEPVEICGSHFGMGVNAHVYQVIARVLALTETPWRNPVDRRSCDWG